MIFIQVLALPKFLESRDALHRGSPEGPGYRPALNSVSALGSIVSTNYHECVSVCVLPCTCTHMWPLLVSLTRARRWRSGTGQGLGSLVIRSPFSLSHVQSLDQYMLNGIFSPAAAAKNSCLISEHTCTACRETICFLPSNPCCSFAQCVLTGLFLFQCWNKGFQG